uniref:Iojap-like ribosome-associated protein n=1 Tax=Arcella intermedia TaxID=1963864 RepID=A0A6B2LJE2_9EUKA
MVYVTGRSGSHLRSMANALMDELKFRKKGTVSIDHKDCDFWVIVNSGDILINIFTEEAREEYDLERTWVLRREPSFVYGAQEEVMKELKFVYDEEDGVYEEVFESSKDKENYTGKGGNEKVKKVYKGKEEKKERKKKIIIIPPEKSKKPAKKVQTKT